MIKNLKENPLKLKELDYKNLYCGNAYIYANEKTASVHLKGEIICTELPPESRVFLKYLYPNHLFIYLNLDDNGEGLKLTEIKSKKTEDSEPETSFSFRGFSKYFDLEPLPPNKETNQSSGVKKDIIPYKFENIIGWLLNIEEFQPKLPLTFDD
jgi:hypothetical protein